MGVNTIYSIRNYKATRSSKGVSKGVLLGHSSHPTFSSRGFPHPLPFSEVMLLYPNKIKEMRGEKRRKDKQDE